MNGKTLLLLILVALGGIILGAVGMQYVGSWEGAAQALGMLRQPRSPSARSTTRVDGGQPTDQPEHEQNTRGIQHASTKRRWCVCPQPRHSNSVSR